MTKKVRLIVISVLLAVVVAVGVLIGVLSVPKYTVTFYTDGGSEVSPITVRKGSKIEQPTSPVKENYSFDGWYTDSDFRNYWMFRSNVVTGNITLYAKWKVAYSLNLSYTSNSDGKSFAVSKGSVSDKDVVIPSKINGMPVTSLAQKAFYNGSFTSIQIPQSVTSIGKDSFNLCVNLTRMVIPDSVEKLGSYAFSGCRELVSVELSDKIKTLESMTFSDCAKLTSVKLPAALEKVGTYAFSDCASLVEIALPAGVVSVGAWAFDGCEKLESITLGGSVTSLGVEMLQGCASLKRIVFQGTLEQWNAVGKNSNWKGDCPVGTVVCSDGQAAI